MNKNILFVWVVLVALSEGMFAETLPELCTRDCAENFGEKVGVSFAGVPAYSNCQNACVNPTPNFVTGVYTGIKWQCVEYARRWLLVNQGVVYGDVDIAADIWGLDYVRTPHKKNQFVFKGFVNGSPEAPQRGDLLIYSKEFYGTGHVAVVLQVDAERKNVLVGEQNFDNNKWTEQYARAIPYVTNNSGIWLLDSYLIGWKRAIY